jgi:hypothetical protein
MLFFNGADGNAKPLSDFAVGELFDLAEEKHNTASLREFRDSLLEDLKLLARHDLLLDARLGRGRHLGDEGIARQGRYAAAFETVDCEAPSCCVKQCLWAPCRLIGQ